MGHNTCKSMGRVLCVVRRQIYNAINYVCSLLFVVIKSASNEFLSNFEMSAGYGDEREVEVSDIIYIYICVEDRLNILIMLFLINHVSKTH